MDPCPSTPQQWEELEQLMALIKAAGPSNLAELPEGWKMGRRAGSSEISYGLIKSPSGAIFSVTKDFWRKEVTIATYTKERFSPEDLEGIDS